ncbi:hypothetical protein BLNAU_22884 [Blattamonas nauphoetae]|uniref:DUF4371 domain-containing protein n=1 Tax=Blattamonas nauphoetae TaxID=2049346 RepID=A0ABQ9WRS6_9EUKA|nr:hypothetical protein BLNAU_22884 [Blattamonas nauphoetae]
MAEQPIPPFNDLSTQSQLLLTEFAKETSPNESPFEFVKGLGIRCKLCFACLGGKYRTPQSFIDTPSQTRKLCDLRKHINSSRHQKSMGTMQVISTPTLLHPPIYPTDVFKTLVQNLFKSSSFPFFSLSLDTSRDKTGEDHLLSGAGNVVCDEVMKVVKKKELSILQCVSTSTDGASSMRGEGKGFLGAIRREGFSGIHIHSLDATVECCERLFNRTHPGELLKQITDRPFGEARESFVILVNDTLSFADDLITNLRRDLERLIRRLSESYASPLRLEGRRGRRRESPVSALFSSLFFVSIIRRHAHLVPSLPSSLLVRKLTFESVAGVDSLTTILTTNRMTERQFKVPMPRRRKRPDKGRCWAG